MDENGIGMGSLRFFGYLLLLAAGVVGTEAIVGFFWFDLAPLDVRSVLVGWGSLTMVAGILSIASRMIGIRWPRLYRWIFGIGIGLVLPLKLGINHPASLVAAGALTSLIVVFVDFVYDDGGFSSVLSVVLLLLLVLSSDWFWWVDPSPAGEVAFSSFGAAVLGLVLVLLYRDPVGLSNVVEDHTGLVSGVMLAVFAAGLIIWSTTEARKERPSYFSGTVPEMSGPEGSSLEDMPNIILISVDTLRADRVPPDAPEGIEVPAMRSLMRDSVRLTRVFSSSSWTLPSHASLFTGLPPMAHGAVNSERSRIYPAVPSYVQMLRDLGYQTVAFTDGGYVSDDYGFSRGFEHYQSSYDFDVNRKAYLQPGIQELGEKVLRSFALSFQPPPPGTEPQAHHYFWENLRAARVWLSSERDPERPFLLFLHTYQTHDYLTIYPRSIRRLKQHDPELARAATRRGPVGSKFRSLAPDEKRRLFQRLKAVEDTSVRTAFTALAQIKPSIWNVLGSWVLSLTKGQWKGYVDLSPKHQKNVLNRAAQGAYLWGLPATPNLRTDYGETSYSEWLGSTFNLKPETARRIEARNRLKMKGLEWLYDDLVEDIDRSLGKFLDHLRSKGLYDDSLIVFLSDHGEGFSWSPPMMGHGLRNFRDGRGQLRDALTHVPVWMKPPADSPSGGVCGELYQLRDVFPIVFRELGIQTLDRVPMGELGRSDKGFSYCPPTRRTLAKGSVAQRKAWLEFRPRFYVRGEGYRLEVQREPVGLRSFWKLEDREPDRRVSADAVPEASRGRLQKAMKEYLRRFDEHPDPYRQSGWEANEELEAELRGLGYF